MKQLTYLTIAACAVFALVFTALGGPEPMPTGKEMKQVAPTPVPECSWTGFYVGLHVGGQFGHSEDFDVHYNAFDHPFGYSESGVIAGGQVGYNWQWNWLVLGPEFDLGYMNLDGSTVDPRSRRFGASDTHASSDSDFYTTLRGRIGVALNHWLIYATGGGIGVNYETRFVDDCSISPCSPGTVDAHKQEIDWGYTVGGGIEHMFNCHWSIKAEYLYFSLDDQDFSAPNNFGENQPFHGETTGHIVRAGLNYKF